MAPRLQRRSGRQFGMSMHPEDQEGAEREASVFLFFVLDTEALLRAKTLTMGVVEEAGYSWVCSRKFTGRKSKSRLAPATEILGQALRYGLGAYVL